MGCCQEQERGPWRVEGSWVVRTHRGRSQVAEGHPWGPKALSSRSERARPAGAEKMRARSARFFSSLYKLELLLLLLLLLCPTKIEQDHS